MILDQADEDDILDFEHSDIEDGEEERLRQEAESVPLRPLDYVDPVQAVVAQWLVKETEKILQPQPSEVPVRSRKGPLKLSLYDEDESDELATSAVLTSESPVSNSADLSASPPVPPVDLPAPPPVPPVSPADLPASPPVPASSIPQAVITFLVDTVTQDAPSTMPDSSDREARAWNLLNDYLNGSLEGDVVKTGLDALHLNEEWDNMRIRIMQVEPGEDDAVVELQRLLDKMKPAQQFEVEDKPTDVEADIGSVVSPESDDEDEDEIAPERLTKEQQELANFVHTYLGRATTLEDFEIFYVRCRVSCFCI